VAAIAAARARVAYRNNAVAPASIDPVSDGRGGLVCPADYHLMGGDDKAIDHSNSYTLYVPFSNVGEDPSLRAIVALMHTHRGPCYAPARLARDHVPSTTQRGLSSRNDGQILRGGMFDGPFACDDATQVAHHHPVPYDGGRWSLLVPEER
jgi:hypothetical protein